MKKLLKAALYLLLTAGFLAASPNYAAGNRQFPSPDKEAESAVLELSKRLYTNEPNRDSAEWLKLWHENCPTIPRRKRDFPDKESIYNLKKTELKLLSFTMESGRDKLFADAEISFAGEGKNFTRQLGLIKEGAEWKIWHESSLEEYQKALNTANANESQPEIAEAQSLAEPLTWIGYRFYEKRDYKNSIRIFSLAIKYAKEAGDNYLLTSALIQTGHSQLESDDRAAALQSYLEAERISNSEMIETGISRALGGMGNAYTILGEYFKARDAIRKRLAMLRQNGSQRRIANTLNNLGNLYFRIGDYEAAQKALEESASIIEHSGTYLNLGFVFAEKGDYKTAERYFQESIKLAKKDGKTAEVTRSLNGLGMIAFKRGNYREALSLFEEIIDSKSTNKTEQSQIIINAAYARFKLKDYEPAIFLLKKALKIAEENNDFEPKWFGKYVLGECLKAVNKPKEALAAFRESIGLIEDWLKRAEGNEELEDFFHDKAGPYREAVDLYAANGEFEQALKFAEISKAKSLLKSTKGIKLNADSGEGFSLQSLNKIIPGNESALIEFVIGDDSSFIFLITRPSKNSRLQLTVKRIAKSRKEIDDLVKNFRAKIASENYDFSEDAQRIYEILLKPIENQLANKKSVVIVPDNILWGMPFQALKKNSSQFLLEQFSISYARSLLSLVNSDEKDMRAGPKSPSLLGIANPTSLKPILFAEESLKILAPFYDQSQSAIYTGDSATEEKIKLVISKYDVIHFAAHGVIDDKSPMSSYLQLASDGSGEDGKLEAQELQQLNLKADMVILAGCETGLGKNIDGEGIIGLAWALEKAGVPQIIVSQWKVRDKSTKDLMAAFHYFLRNAPDKNGPPDAGDALRQAALSMQKKYPHPVYWSGFVAIRNGG